MKISKRTIMTDSISGSCISLTRNPRIVMYERLPSIFQPFLTWLTAQPVPGEHGKNSSPISFVLIALMQTLLGCMLTVETVHISIFATIVGMLMTTAGLGIFQVVVFHHCSHGTVFRGREANIFVGRIISATVLFKHFDDYKKEHMLHHSNNKLLTSEDEFAGFVFDVCSLQAGVALSVLRRRILLNLISPVFHGRFLMRRISAAWGSHDWRHNVLGMTVWSVLIAVASITGQWLAFVLAWVVPVTVLLQAATVGRILCEHSFPEPDVIAARGKDFTCHATGGVFPGAMPPTGRGLLAWAVWWADMLVVQLPVRLIVLVGDAPCHDFHHRKPASRRWTSYIQARHDDQQAGSSVFGTNYKETWGLFRAVDATLASLSRLPPGTPL